MSGSKIAKPKFLKDKAKIRAALAAHDEAQSQSDALRTAKGLALVLETATARAWREQLGESA